MATQLRSVAQFSLQKEWQKEFNEQLVQAHTTAREEIGLGPVQYSVQCRARAQRQVDKMAKEDKLERGGCDGLSGPPHGQNLLKIAVQKGKPLDKQMDGESVTLKWLNGPACFKAQALWSAVDQIGGAAALTRDGSTMYLACHYITGLPLEEVAALEDGASLDDLCAEAASTDASSILAAKARKKQAAAQAATQAAAELEASRAARVAEKQRRTELEQEKREQEEQAAKSPPLNPVLAKEQAEKQAAKLLKQQLSQEKTLRAQEKERLKNDPVRRRDLQRKAMELQESFRGMLSLFLEVRPMHCTKPSCCSHIHTGIAHIYTRVPHR